MQYSALLLIDVVCSLCDTDVLCRVMNVVLHAGTFGAHFVRGASVVEAATAAVAVAAMSVQRKGSQKSYPLLEEVPECYRPRSLNSSST